MADVGDPRAIRAPHRLANRPGRARDLLEIAAVDADHKQISHPAMLGRFLGLRDKRDASAIRTPRGTTNVAARFENLHTLRAVAIDAIKLAAAIVEQSRAIVLDRQAALKHFLVVSLLALLLVLV